MQNPTFGYEKEILKLIVALYTKTSSFGIWSVF